MGYHCSQYHLTFEPETGKRQKLISQIFAQFGEESFAADNPCRVIREITQEDSMIYKPDVYPYGRI